MNNLESTNNGDKEFNAWADKLEQMSDLEVSRELFNRIMLKGNLDNDTKKLLNVAYEYCFKLISQDKMLEPNLLKIYLEEIEGYEISHINLVNLVYLLSLCGIAFDKTN